MFRRRPGHLLYVLCTFSLHAVSAAYMCHWHRSGVFIINVEHISHLDLVFYVIFEQVNAGWVLLLANSNPEKTLTCVFKHPYSNVIAVINNFELFLFDILARFRQKHCYFLRSMH